jgi:hypothetical protein
MQPVFILRRNSMPNLHEISDADLQAELLRRAEEKHKRFIRPESPVGWWRVSTEGDEEGKSTKDLGMHYGHICELALRLAGATYYKLHFQEIPSPVNRYAPGDIGVVSVQSIAQIAGNTVTETEVKKLAEFFGPEWSVSPHNYYQTIKVSRK